MPDQIVCQPYTRPNKPIEDFTPEESRAYLDNHFATMPDRQKQADSFNKAAAISLGATLLVPIVAILLAMIFHK